MQKLRKDQGDTFNSILPNLLCVIIISVFCTLFTSWMANVANRDALNQITRKYILQMETTGYLTGDMKNELTNELFLAGMRSIKIEPRTNQLANKAEYGEDIYLVVSGYMPVFEYQIHENPDGKFMELEDPNVNSPDVMRWEVFISKSSISKAPATPIEEPDKFKIKLAVQGLGHTAGNGQITYAGKRVSVVTVEKGEKPTFKFEANAGYYISDVYLDTNRLDPAAYNINAEKTVGQYTVNDGNGVQAPHSIVVVTAPFNNIKYTVNHYQSGFTGNYVLFETEVFAGTTDTEVTPTVKKYEGFTSPVSQTVVVKPDGSTVVNYYYERNKYFLTINEHEHIDTQDSSNNGEYYFGQEIKIKGVISYNPTQAVIFTGWTDNYNNKYDVNCTFNMPAKDVTLTPSVSYKTYTITFDPNGGTGTAFTTNPINYLNTYNLDKCNFKRDGYIFLGWSRDKNAVAADYNDTETIHKLAQIDASGQLEENIILYAVWSDLGETSFTIHHFVQQVDGSYTTEPQKIEKRDALTSDIYTFSDLIFKDYDDNKTTSFRNMQEGGYEITMFTPLADGSSVVCLYYERLQYTFSINTNTSGITIDDAVTTFKNNTYYAGQTITFTTNIKKGYVFEEWIINSGTVNLSPTEIPTDATSIEFTFKMPSENVAIEGKYHCIDYNVNINLDGGSWEGSYKPYVKYNVETATFTIENPVKKHYTFIGWTDLNKADSGELYMVYTISQGTTGDINLKANWLINKYTLTFNNPGTRGTIKVKEGDNAEAAVIFNNDELTKTLKYDYNTKLKITFEPVDKNSLFFLKLEETADGTTVENILIDDETFVPYIYDINSLDHNYNFNVNFDASGYKIIYHSNDGKDNTETGSYTFTYNMTLKENPWEFKNYTFMGWSKQIPPLNLLERDVVEYLDFHAGESARDLATYPGEEMHLYAIWLDQVKPSVSYTITNNMSTEQTMKVTVSDTKSGIKGIHYSSYEENESMFETFKYRNTTAAYSYLIDETSKYIYMYVSDNVYNVKAVGPIVIFRTNLVKNKGTFNYNYNYIMTVSGNKIPLPTGTLDYHKFLGWSENASATTGSTNITADKDRTLYPIYVKNGAQLIDGIAFNTAIKQLVSTTATFETVDNTITNIKYTGTAPSASDKTVKVSVDGNSLDVVAYKSGTEILLYTTAEEVFLPADSRYMFYNLQKLSGIDMLSTKLMTTKATDMSWMFAYAGYNGSLSSLNLGRFNTSKVTNMQGMFANCGYNNLSSISFGSNFNTANVTDMSAMFENFGHKKLTSLSVNFDTAKVTNMKAMFAYTGYEAMTSLTLGSNFKASVLNDTSYMFSYTGYKKLGTLTITSNFKVPASANKEWMFLNCGHTNLASLDISMIQFNTSDTSKTEGMLIDCGKDSATITVVNSTAVSYINTNAAKILGTTSSAKTIKAK